MVSFPLCSFYSKHLLTLFFAASPVHEKFLRGSPRTPQDNFFPPDPSGLSISANNAPHSIANDFNTTPDLPATPTGPRDSFLLAGKRPSISLNGYNAPDVDPSLTSRFENVELIGTGEFSQVFRVSQPRGEASSSVFRFLQLDPRPQIRYLIECGRSRRPNSPTPDSGTESAVSEKWMS